MRILVVINRFSARGNRPALLAKIKFKLSAYLHEIVYTDEPRYYQTLVSLLSGGRVDTVVIVGGDGTVNRVINDCHIYNPLFGLIPSGRSNDLARQHGISTDTDTACNLILTGRIVKINSMILNGRMFLTNAGIGLPTRIVRLAGVWQKRGSWVIRKMGAAVYLLGFIRALFARHRQYQQMKILIDHKMITVKPYSIVIGINQILGTYFKVFPSARSNQLGLYVISLNRGRFFAVITAIKTLFGIQEKSPDTSYYFGRRISLYSKRPIKYFGDGELMPPECHLDCNIQDNSVRIILPSGKGEE